MTFSIRLLGTAVSALFLFAVSPVAAVAPKNPPPGPAITSVELNQEKTLLEQPCPRELYFDGRIAASRSTAVTYTWVDSHGHVWPEHHRRLLAGNSAVRHKWKLGHPGKTVDEWVQLKIVAPQSMLSNKVAVHFTCAK